MVHTSHALITATLALSAAGPMLAAPVEPRINFGFPSVNIHAPILPPTQSPATEPVAVPAPVPVLEAAPELEARGAMTSAAVGRAVGGGSFSVIHNLNQRLFSRAGGAAPDSVPQGVSTADTELQPVPAEGASTADDAATDAQPGKQSKLPKWLPKGLNTPGRLGWGLGLPFGTAAVIGTSIAVGNTIQSHQKQRDLDADKLHLLGRDLDTDVLRLLHDRDLEDLFTRSFGIDDISKSTRYFERLSHL